MILDSEGKLVDTGEKLTPNGLDVNGDFWDTDENGRLYNTGERFGRDGYSIYGIDKNGWGKNKKHYSQFEYCSMFAKGMDRRKMGKPVYIDGVMDEGKDVDTAGRDYSGINPETHFGKNGHFYKIIGDEWVDTGSLLDDNFFDEDGNFWAINEDGERYNTHSPFADDGFSRYGINIKGWGRDKLWYNGDRYGKPQLDQGRKTDYEGYDYDGLDEKNQDREKHTYKRLEDGTLVDISAEIYDPKTGLNVFNVDRHSFGIDNYYYIKTEDGQMVNSGSKLNTQQLDSNGDFWLIENGEPFKNTYQKFGLDGYSLYDINRFGFGRDKLWYGVDKSGRPQNTVGSEKSPQGYDAYEFDEHNFGRNAHYYVEQEDGNWVDTGKILNSRGFDKNRIYWREVEEIPESGSANMIEIDGKKYICTGQEFDDNGFNIDDYDREGYGRDTFNKQGINRENFGRSGDYYIIVDGEYVNTHEKFNKKGRDIEGRDSMGYNEDEIDRYGFNKNFIYCIKQEDGKWVETGLTYNPMGFEVNRKVMQNPKMTEIVYINRITNTVVDARHFDIAGRCKSNNDSIYDINGFKQDGTYLETGEKYHDGYNAFDVDENGKDRTGKTPNYIKLTEYIINQLEDDKPVKLWDVFRKFYPKSSSINFKTEIWKAGEAYPKIKEKIVALRSKIAKIKTAREVELKRAITNKENYRLRVETLKKQIEELEMHLKIFDV